MEKVRVEIEVGTWIFWDGWDAEPFDSREQAIARAAELGIDDGPSNVMRAPYKMNGVKYQ